MEALQIFLREKNEKAEKYEKEIDSIIEETDSDDEETLKRIRKLIQSLQHEVVGQLKIEIDKGHWGAIWSPKLLAAVKETIDEMTKRYHKELEDFAQKRYSSSIHRVDSTVKAGITIGPNVGKPSEHEVVLAARIKPSLISGYNAAAKEKLGFIISKHILSGNAPQKLIDELSQNIDTRGTPFHNIRYRAEIIARTETSRIRNAAAVRRMLDHADRDPKSNLKAQLIVAKSKTGPCEECTKLWEDAPEGSGVWPLRHKDFPHLPAHVSCRCCMIPYFEEVSPRPRHPKMRNAKLKKVLASKDEK